MQAELQRRLRQTAGETKLRPSWNQAEAESNLCNLNLGKDLWNAEFQGNLKGAFQSAAYVSSRLYFELQASE